MRHHYYTPRGARLVVMNDREIAEVSRCYRCGGHHVARVTCGHRRNSPVRVIFAAVAFAAAILAVV